MLDELDWPFDRTVTPVCARTKCSWLWTCVKCALTFLLFSLCVAVTLPTYNVRTIFSRKYNPNLSCRTFMSDGHYELNENDWVPNGCSMHHYNKQSVTACMKRALIETKRRSYFLFVGDSRIRGQYQLFVDAAATRPYKVSRLKGPAMYTDLFDAEYVPDNYLDFIPQLLQNRTTPSFVVFGATSWFLTRSGHDHEAGLQIFIDTMNKVAQKLKLAANVTKFIWMSTAPYLRSHVYKHGCSGSRSSGGTRLVNTAGCPEKHPFTINPLARRYNDAAVQIFSNSSRSMYIWAAARNIVHSFIFDQTDSTHLMQAKIDTPPSPALHLRGQMLLNFHCNRFRDTDTAGTDDVDVCCANKISDVV